jgi:hypothetical protein
MNARLTETTYEIHLHEGEVLTLPEDVADILGPGNWTVSIRPAGGEVTRDHTAFLKSFAPEDEGLYDDYQAG